MKLLLINPICYDSIDNFITHSKTRKINSDEPLSLCYLSSYIKQQLPKIECEVFDWHVSCLECLYEYNLMKGFRAEWIQGSLKKDLYKNDFIKILKNKIKEYTPDIVGVSGLYEYNKQPFHETLEIIKNINSEIITVVGGIYPTTYDLSFNKNIDCVVRGEGELRFTRLIEEIIFSLNNPTFY